MVSIARRKKSFVDFYDIYGGSWRSHILRLKLTRLTKPLDLSYKRLQYSSLRLRYKQHSRSQQLRVSATLFLSNLRNQSVTSFQIGTHLFNFELLIYSLKSSNLAITILTVTALKNKKDKRS